MHNFDLRSKVLSLDNKNKNIIILYCPRLFVPLSPNSTYIDLMEQKKITFDSFIRGTITVVAVIGIIMLLNRLSGVLLPFFLAWLIAYLLFPVVKFFQYRCKMKYRLLGIFCTFITAAIILTGLSFLIVPPILEESERARDLLITYVSKDAFMSNIPNMIEEFIHENMTKEDVKALITQDGFIDTVKQAVPKVWDVIEHSINIVSSMLMMTMVVIYTLFILLDYEKFSRGWVLLLPERYRKIATQVANDVETGMNKYFRGQGLVAFKYHVLHHRIPVLMNNDGANLGKISFIPKLFYIICSKLPIS